MDCPETSGRVRNCGGGAQLDLDSTCHHIHVGITGSGVHLTLAWHSPDRSVERSWRRAHTIITMSIVHCALRLLHLVSVLLYGSLLQMGHVAILNDNPFSILPNFYDRHRRVEALVNHNAWPAFRLPAVYQVVDQGTDESTMTRRQDMIRLCPRLQRINFLQYPSVPPAHRSGTEGSSRLNGLIDSRD